MNPRPVASILIFVAAIFISSRCCADDDGFNFGISVPALVQYFPSVFADASGGLRFASCYSLNADAGGPAEAFLVFLPPGTRSQFPEFDAVFFWINSDEIGRYLSDYGFVELLRDDMFVTAAQGGNGTDEAMERTIVPLLNSHPGLTHSAAEIFERPRRRCRYAAHWDYINPKPRHRPKIKSEWFAAGASDGRD